LKEVISDFVADYLLEVSLAMLRITALQVPLPAAL
jgi:hypothetical protein